MDGPVTVSVYSTEMVTSLTKVSSYDGLHHRTGCQVFFVFCLPCLLLFTRLIILLTNEWLLVVLNYVSTMMQ